MICHFAEILQPGELQLPQGFKHGDGHRIAQVQAPGLGPHRDTNAGIEVVAEKILRQTLGLLAEEQVAPILELCFGIAPGGLGGQTPHLAHFVLREEVLQIFVVSDIYQIPVIQTGPLDGLFRDVKTQRADQMQVAPGSRTGACDVTAVLRNLRLHQNDIEHFVHLGSVITG